MSVACTHPAVLESAQKSLTKGQHFASNVADNSMVVMKLIDSCY